MCLQTTLFTWKNSLFNSSKSLPCCTPDVAPLIVFSTYDHVRIGRHRGTKTNTNENITAEKVLLVLETKDGSKEHTLVSRQRALDAAEAANLDLVQGKSCFLVS